jgi:hypothetical protein
MFLYVEKDGKGIGLLEKGRDEIKLRKGQRKLVKKFLAFYYET